MIELFNAFALYFGKFTYLALNIFSIFIPFIFSFERRIAFYKKWKTLFPAIAITGLFFIVWDHYLTVWSVWSFNPDYVIGIYLWNLPIEEWLFFFCIPYACLYIYESMNYFFEKKTSNNSIHFFSLTLGLICLVTGIYFHEKLYTGIKLTLAGCMLLFVFIRKFEFMWAFYRAYIISLIPFFIVNGALTAIPVVLYNNDENLSIRISTIPIEDTMYSLLMLLMTTVFFEYFQKRNAHK